MTDRIAARENPRSAEPDRLKEEDLLLCVDFDTIKGNVVKSSVGNDGILHHRAEDMRVKSYDGGTALSFGNPAGRGCAAEYVNFGKLPFGTRDFTVQFWMKTRRDGCNGWSAGPKAIAPDTFAGMDRLADEQKTRGGVILSNTDFSSADSAGFTVANLQQFVYLNTAFKAEGVEPPVRLSGMKAAADDRWHQITLTFDRDGMQSVYIDDKVLMQADLSGMSGRSIDAGDLVLGADGLGQYGLGEVTIGGLRVYRAVMPAQQVRTDYFIGGTLNLVQELYQRNIKPGAQYTREAVDSMLLLAGEYERKAAELRRGASTSEEEARTLYRSFWEKYESFLLHTKKPNLKFMLLTDIHAEGSGCPRAEAFANALDWANDLEMDAYMDGGDYSFFGKDHELNAYWDAVARGRKNLKAFVSLGNHETLERKSAELVRYHTGKLAETGMFPEGYDKLYYEGEVNGYHFLVLAQYSDTYTVTGYNGLWVHAGEIKEEQLTWLRERLELYANRGKPVFVVIHNAVREVLAKQTDGDYKERSVLLCAEGLYEILDRYPDVILSTGHVHHGLGACCGVYRTKAGYHVIDVPSFRCNQKGYGKPDFEKSGQMHTGYFVSVYDDAVQLRAVDFVSREWLTAYDQAIELKKRKA